jgi:hypothetical protein
MANPMPNENEILEKIDRGEIFVDPEILELLHHHIGNDLQVIYLAVNDLKDAPAWIFKTTRWVNNIFLLIRFRRPGSRVDVNKVYQETFTRIKNINEVLKKVKSVSRYYREDK